MPPAATTASSRRTDLDALRVTVCFSVILAHALLIFAAEPRYHVKSASPWVVATVGYEFMRIATLAIFFVLAGWSAVVSLRRRVWTRYIKERLSRVLLPLTAGIILLGPIIKWIELGQGRDLRINGFRLVAPPEFGLFEFLPRYLGRLQLLTWSHLWFLAYLFLISLALLPVLLPLARRIPSMAVPDRALAYAPAALLGGYIAVSGGYWPFLPNLVQDWANLGYFALCFLAGAGMAAWPGYEARLRAEAPWLAALAVIGLVVVIGAGESTMGRIGVGLCAWGCIGAGLGFTGRHPPAPGPLLAWLGEATMPVYVLHHIPVLLFGVLLLPLGWPAWLTVLAVTAGATVVSLAAYRLLVQPWPWPRVLVGMEPRPHA
jgi:glucan biosynthesis protein C